MKMGWYQKKWVIILLHAAAWALLFSLPFLLQQPYKESKPSAVDINRTALHYLRFITNLIWVGLFYFNAFILIQNFIYKRRYGVYALIQLLIIGALIVIHILFFKFFITQFDFTFSGFIFFNIFPYLFILATSTAYQMIRDKLKADKLAKEKENENLKTELSFLRSQVSPHFMFNVLNNMVALARKQSDQLEPSLIKLSSLMRYMLYEADEEKVPLEKEIEYLHSYIDLQQQRFGKKLKVDISFDALNDQHEIEPMLLIPFVENAFKHGTGMIEEPQIDIDLKTKNNILFFTVRNKYNNQTEEIKDKTSGIGLTNVKRRLNLLYGTNQSLLITKKDCWFVTSLQLNLH